MIQASINYYYNTYFTVRGRPKLCNRQNRSLIPCVNEHITHVKLPKYMDNKAKIMLIAIK
jgi:hypothetical protein